MRWAANWSATSGRLFGSDSTSPRAMSSSSGKSERHRLAGAGARQIAVGGDDARHLRGFARSRDDDFIAGADGPARDRAGEAAKIEMRPVDPLHGEAKRLAALVFLDIDLFEKVEQRRPLVPGRIGAPRRDIVAVPGGDRDRRDRFEAERRGEGGKIGDDLVEAGLIEAGEIDLVDGQHDMPDADQRRRSRRGGRSASAAPCAHRPAEWRGWRWRRRSPYCAYIAHGRAYRR